MNGIHINPLPLAPLTSLNPLADLQSSHDSRELAITRVGVKSVRHPVVLRIDNTLQPTVGTWDLAVHLDAHLKGTHMSRFIAWLQSHTHGPHQGLCDKNSMSAGLQSLLDLLDAKAGLIEAKFPFFLSKKAPVSKVESLLDYEGSWRVERRPDEETCVRAKVMVPVKSLCPCSKEISDYGAHNQRSHVTIDVELKADIAWKELVRFAEDHASSEVWGILKRPDEKWITERAYNHPKFAEDLVRDVALALNKDARIGNYRVEVENFESIHNHSAYACIERGVLN